MGLEERTLVVFQPEPGHALQDGVHRLGGGALEVGVLDAQDEGAAVLARIQPGEQRGARAADVQVTGGARGKSGANGHGNGRWSGMDAYGKENRRRFQLN